MLIKAFQNFWYKKSYSTIPISSEILQFKKIKENVDIIQKKFNRPKNVLHCYYDVVSNELNSKTYRVSPSYRYMPDTNWECIYKINWPEPKNIRCMAPNKKEASHKAAIEALAWLNSINKLTPNGSPIICDKRKKHSLEKKLITLTLKETSQQTFSEIFSLYDTVKDDLENQLNAIQNFKTSTDFDNNCKLIEDWAQQDFSHEENWSEDELLELYSAKEDVKLPISDFKNEFENLIEKNRVVIIKGETGCGKSTRIPQYLLEHWVKTRGSEKCFIAVTQPRRIAAISLAQRVSEERKESVGQVVGYHVRLNMQFNPSTARILYCTTGILLRKLQADPALTNCSYVVLDEVHERDVNTDLLMALLRQSMKLNPSLKLVVMSATINTELFKDYFDNAPVLDVPGIIYSVKKHFIDDLTTLNLNDTRNMCKDNYPFVVIEDVVSVIKWIHENKPDGAILCFLPGWEEINKVKSYLENIVKIKNCLILCLHSRLPDKEQSKIFGSPPILTRKIILSTNIAETSITINDIVYVIDSGIRKNQYFNVEKNMICMDNFWITKSNMNQRKGRAGRVMHGESYHLYTRELFDNFENDPLPDILNVPLSKIILEAKFYSKNQDAEEFFQQLICSPKPDAIKKGIEELKNLELLDIDENLTSLGKAIALFPLSPQLSKAMVYSVIFQTYSPILNITTFFNEDSETFTIGLMDKHVIRESKKKFCKFSDHLALWEMFKQWNSLYLNEAQDFCYDNYLNSKRFYIIRKLEEIHADYLQSALKPIFEFSDLYSNNSELINGILLSSTGLLLRRGDSRSEKGRSKSNNIYLNRHGNLAIITPESVNRNNIDLPSSFLVYLSELKSNILNCILVRESAILSPLTVALFDPNDIHIVQELGKLFLKNSRIAFTGSNEDFERIAKFRTIIQNFVQYFIYQMTEGGHSNETFISTWNQILSQLNVVLKNESLLEKSDKVK